ncbi:MAG: hypothetical protein K2N89_05590, partial [Lachnospiraceae bacterium]|nr:hypothetical protein [Lachnospiraceae bacterium]
MDEQRSWMKSRRKKRLRIGAVMLCFCLLITTYPNIPENVSVFAAGMRGEDEVMSIFGFAELPEEISRQTVPMGTPVEELTLPDTLEAYVTVEAEDNTEEETKTDATEGETKPDDTEGETKSDATEGETKPDAGDQNKDDDDRNKDDNENLGEEDKENEDTDTHEADDEDGDIEEIKTEEGKQEDPADGEKTDSNNGNNVTEELHTVTMEKYNAENVVTVNILENTQDSGTQEESVTIEGITWQSNPKYDKDTEGVYTFTPVLPESYALADGVSLPQITVTVEFQGQQLTQEQYERMMAGLQDYPELLTEEDILKEDPSLAAQAAGAPRRAAARTAAQTHPGTYLTTTDNENNAGTGKPDGDMDKYVYSYSSCHPIEANIFIPEGMLPTQNCYIAVRTYDVNWRGLGRDWAEYDKLFINDVRIGTLTGLDRDWNTSYYRVPLSCLREGNNTVRIEIWDC